MRDAHYWDQIFGIACDYDTLTPYCCNFVDADTFGPDSYLGAGEAELVALHVRGFIYPRVTTQTLHSMSIVYDRGSSESYLTAGGPVVSLPVVDQILDPMYGFGAVPITYTNADYHDRFEILRRTQWMMKAKTPCIEVEMWIPLNGRRIKFRRPYDGATRPVETGGVHLVLTSNIAAPYGPIADIHTRLWFKPKG